MVQCSIYINYFILKIIAFVSDGRITETLSKVEVMERFIRNPLTTRLNDEVKDQTTRASLVGLGSFRANGSDDVARINALQQTYDYLFAWKRMLTNFQQSK